MNRSKHSPLTSKKSGKETSGGNWSEVSFGVSLTCPILSKLAEVVQRVWWLFERCKQVIALRSSQREWCTIRWTLTAAWPAWTGMYQITVIFIVEAQFTHHLFFLGSRKRQTSLSLQNGMESPYSPLYSQAHFSPRCQILLRWGGFNNTLYATETRDRNKFSAGRT